MTPRRATARPTKKIFHKIGEVCELTKTEPYVLRYWESEFPFLAPEKNRAGQRIYSDDDIEMVLAIKRLLYEEGYTTAGARRRLEKELQERRGTDPSAATAEPAAASTAAPATAAASAEPTAGTAGPAAHDEMERLRGALLRVRGELRDLRARLERDER
jgi:DNA-binding transcriptional MerR regulator